MESVPSFRARAADIGMRVELIDRLVGAGIDTFGKLAYVCSVSPTAGDDGPLRDALGRLLADGDPLTPQDMIFMRRLWFESYTLTVTELQNKMQKSPSDTPKSIPLAERLVRIEEQRDRLKGLVYDQFLEPAHSLTDKVQAMLEDGVVTYLAPEKCISRHDEIQSNKTEQQLTFDAQGNVKVSKAESTLSCDATGELRLRQCLTRKALAFDQIKLCGNLAQCNGTGNHAQATCRTQVCHSAANHGRRQGAVELHVAEYAWQAQDGSWTTSSPGLRVDLVDGFTDSVVLHDPTAWAIIKA